MYRCLPFALIAVFSVLLSGCPSRTPEQERAAAAASSVASAASTAVSVGTYASLPPDTRALTDTLAKAGRPTEHGEAIDNTTFPYPVAGGRVSPDGYPIYLIECSDLSKVCVGPTGEAIGSITVVAHTLSPIRNVDVLNPQYHCALICTDNHGNVVGAVSAAMVKYLAVQKASTETVVPTAKANR